MSDVKITFRANAKINDEFIFIETYSGYRSARADYKGNIYVLSPDVGDVELGEAVVGALSKSRFVLAEPREGLFVRPEVEFDKKLYDIQHIKQHYENWVKNMSEMFNYKNRKSLFKSMKNCDIEKFDHKISITPSKHEKLEGWSGEGISDNDCVILNDDATPGEIGAGLRLAFSRCI